MSCLLLKQKVILETHWNDVMRIIDDTIIDIGIKKGRIVSDGGAITTIHSRIVNNFE